MQIVHLPVYNATDNIYKRQYTRVLVESGLKIFKDKNNLKKI